MKLIKPILCFLLCVCLLFGCSIMPEEPTVPTTDPPPPVTDPTAPPTQPPTEPVNGPTEPSAEPPTQPPTEPVISSEAQLWGSMDQVTVYPYDAAELKEATDYWQSVLNQVNNQEGVLEFECHWISFDPYYTHKQCQSYLRDAPVEGWNEADYYSNTLCLVFSFTVKYDHTKSPGMDYTNQLGSVMLTRESPDSPWQYNVLSPSAFTYTQASNMLLSPDEVNGLNLTEEFVLAGYFLEAGNPHHPVERDTYYLFILDLNNDAIVCKAFPVQ